MNLARSLSLMLVLSTIASFSWSHAVWLEARQGNLVVVF